MLYDVQISSAPATEPVTASEVKTFLNISYSTDDAIIGTMITSARYAIEQYTKRAFITQTIIAYYKRYDKTVNLPFQPIQSVTTVETVADDSTTPLTANSNYYVKGVQDKYLDFTGVNSIPAGHSPYENTATYGLKVTYVAGYGSANAVPQSIKDAIVRLTAYYYDNRADFVTGTIIQRLPLTVTSLLNGYKRYV